MLVDLEPFLEAIRAKIGKRNGSRLSRTGALNRIRRKVRDKATPATRDVLRSRRERKQRDRYKARKNTKHSKANANKDAEEKKKNREDKK